jgi:formate-dependent nitrite reductase membrane component NrfD
MPAPGETVNSAAFTVPRGAYTMTVHCPALASAATVAIQVLEPQGDDQVTDAWRTASSVAGVTLTAYTGMVLTNTASTIPIAALGGGVMRFVASATQAGAPTVIKLVFHMLP